MVSAAKSNSAAASEDAGFCPLISNPPTIRRVMRSALRIFNNDEYLLIKQILRNFLFIHWSYSIVEKYITQYPIDGDNIVTKPKFELSPNKQGAGSTSCALMQPRFVRSVSVQPITTTFLRLPQVAFPSISNNGCD